LILSTFTVLIIPVSGCVGMNPGHTFPGGL